MFSLGEKFNRDVAWNVGSLVALGLSGVMINSVIVAWRGSETLGVFNQVLAVYIVLGQITVGGMHISVLQQVSHYQDDRARCGRITAAGLLLALVSSSVVTLLALTQRDLIGRLLDSPDVAEGLGWALPGLVLFSLNKVLRSALNGVRAMRAFAVFESLRFLVILLGVVGLLAAGRPGTLLPLALSFAEGLVCLTMLAYIHLRQFRFQFSGQLGHWIRQHLSFGGRGCLSGILTEMNTRVDVLVLGFFCNDATVGLYSFAAVLAEGFAQFPAIMRRNVDPMLGSCFARNKRFEIRAMARQIKRVFYPLMAVLGIAGVLAFPIILHLLQVDLSLQACWAVFAILSLGVVLSSGYRPFYGILLQGGRPGIHTLFVAGVVGSNLILNTVLIGFLHAYGAAAATSLVSLLEAGSIIVLSDKLFGVRL